MHFVLIWPDRVILDESRYGFLKPLLSDCFFPVSRTRMKLTLKKNNITRIVFPRRCPFLYSNFLYKMVKTSWTYSMKNIGGDGRYYHLIHRSVCNTPSYRPVSMSNYLILFTWLFYSLLVFCPLKLDKFCCTLCPKSLGPFYLLSYSKNCVKTSCAYSKLICFDKWAHGIFVEYVIFFMPSPRPKEIVICKYAVCTMKVSFL